MQVTPISEEEAKRSAEENRKRFDPLPKGEYDFEVLEAADKVSSAQNEMIEVKLAIYQGDQIVRRVFDYLMPNIDYKLRHACDACGLLAQYQRGNLSASDFVGRTGKCKLKIEPAKNGYSAKNAVEDYCCRPAKALGAENNQQRQPGDDTEFAPEGNMPF